MPTALLDSLSASFSNNSIIASVLDSSNCSVESYEYKIEPQTVKEARFLAQHIETIACKLYTLAYQYDLPIEILTIEWGNTVFATVNIELCSHSRCKSFLKRQ